MSDGVRSPQDPDQEGPKETREAEGRKRVLTSQFDAWIQGDWMGEKGVGDPGVKS